MFQSLATLTMTMQDSGRERLNCGKGCWADEPTGVTTVCLFLHIRLNWPIFSIIGDRVPQNTIHFKKHRPKKGVV